MNLSGDHIIRRAPLPQSHIHDRGRHGDGIHRGRMNWLARSIHMAAPGGGRPAVSSSGNTKPSNPPPQTKKRTPYAIAIALWWAQTVFGTQSFFGGEIKCQTWCNIDSSDSRVKMLHRKTRSTTSPGNTYGCVGNASAGFRFKRFLHTLPLGPLASKPMWGNAK